MQKIKIRILTNIYDYTLGYRPQAWIVMIDVEEIINTHIIVYPRIL